MSKKILWFDNDPSHLRPFIDALRDEGYDVTSVTTITEAERFINAYQYDLLILDVMIPTRNDDEEVIYKPEETDTGHKTGLIFYRRMKKKLEQGATQVLTITIRLDKSIVDEFIAAGLARDHMATKFDLRETSVFIRKVKTLLGEP